VNLRSKQASDTVSIPATPLSRPSTLVTTKPTIQEPLLPDSNVFTTNVSSTTPSFGASLVDGAPTATVIAEFDPLIPQDWMIKFDTPKQTNDPTESNPC
jgi:hypothetical protein